jgi:pilus assembly protein Flp/PilA
MKNLLTRFQNDESGATAIEYGLIAGFVSIAIIASLKLIGPQLSRIFGAIKDALVLAT